MSRHESFPIVMLLIALVCLVGLAQAQGPPPGDPEEQARQRFAELQKRLELTDEQSEQVKPILRDSGEQMREMRERARESGRSRETMQAMRKEAQKLEKETRGKLEPILSPEQLEAYDKLVEEKRQERRNRMQGHGGRGA